MASIVLIKKVIPENGNKKKNIEIATQKQKKTGKELYLIKLKTKCEYANVDSSSMLRFHFFL